LPLDQLGGHQCRGYLQGFFPILELYLYNASQKLTGIADVDTGLRFLDRTSIQPYNSTSSPYEGTRRAPGVQKARVLA
jgi:simple sugar transport system substrate-binding protein